jgi:hypothetical protein
MDQARLAYHLFSGVFAGIFDIRPAYCFRSRGALAGSPLGVLVDSFVGVLAIA